jgi:hypothetical protein
MKKFGVAMTYIIPAILGGVMFFYMAIYAFAFAVNHGWVPT